MEDYDGPCSYEVSLRELLSLMEPVLELLQGNWESWSLFWSPSMPTGGPVWRAILWRNCCRASAPARGEPHLTARRLRYVFGEPRATACFWGKIGEFQGNCGLYRHHSGA